MAFLLSGLKSIVIPSSVIDLGSLSFSAAESLESVTFEDGSQLEQIHENVFLGTRVSFRFVAEALATSRSKAEPPP
jgi:hypothetical protein